MLQVRWCCAKCPPSSGHPTLYRKPLSSRSVKCVTAFFTSPSPDFLSQSDSLASLRWLQPAAGESADLTATVIKVEDDDESWSHSEQESEFNFEFCLMSRSFAIITHYRTNQPK